MESPQEKNRKAWNQVHPIHEKTRPEDLKVRFSDPGFLAIEPRSLSAAKDIGLQGARIMQLCCNNGRELLSLLRCGAVSGTGFDISDAAIAEAEALADIADLDANFVCTDALAIDPAQYQPADILLITVGALAWIPDLPLFFRVAAGLLAGGGKLLIHEQHPCANIFFCDSEPGFDPKFPERPGYSYFRTEPLVSEDGLDYYGDTEYVALPSVEFFHTMGEIVTAVSAAGLRIERLEEYSDDISNSWPTLSERGQLPLSYVLVAEKSNVGSGAPGAGYLPTDN